MLSTCGHLAAVQGRAGVMPINHKGGGGVWGSVCQGV